MSSGTLFVRFPDGTVRYGIYHGTADVARPALYATSDEAWNKRPARWGPSSDEPVGDPVDVRVATNYGGGFSWDGRATLTELVHGFGSGAIEKGWERLDRTEFANVEEGEPDWVKCCTGTG